MAPKIQHKRSAVAGKQPLPTDLEYGEIAVNYDKTDPALYVKDSADIVRRIGSENLWTRTGTVVSPANAGDVVTVSAGTAALPGLTPVGDPNTGLWAPAADTLAFSTNGVEKARLTPSGQLLVGTSTSTANGGVLQVSNGITFPATAVACTDVNTLDDYEEGTWSPTVTAGSGSFTTVSTNGRYVKIGKTCLIACQISITNAGTAAGAITVTNPPFNAAANDFFCGAVADRQTTLAQGGYAKFQSSTSFNVVKYDGTTFIASGNQLIVTIYIETA